MLTEIHQAGFIAHSPVLVISTLLLSCLSIRIIYDLYFHPLARIPGPWSWSCSRLPYIWAFVRGTMVHDIERLHHKYGPVLRIAPNEVTFASKEAWIDIFQSRPNHKPFLKDPIWWNSQPGRPISIVGAIDPEVHSRIRSSIAPAFTLRALRNQEPFIQKYVNLLVERLEEQMEDAEPSQGVELNITPWINFTTFDIFGELGFGESFDCLQHSKYHPWIARVFNSVKAAGFMIATRYYPRIEFLLMKCLPPSLKKVGEDHYQHIVGKVNRRLNWELQQPDIMSHVIQAQSEGKGLLDAEISSTFTILVNAGSETTATTLCGAMNYLMEYPEKLARLTREARSTFEKPEQVTLDSLQSLPYLNAVLQEALRLCPAVPWIMPRIVPAGGDTVCGTWLPGGTPVSIQAWTLNRDSRYFHNAKSFEPERWLPEASTMPTSPYYHDNRQAIQPFSTGPRNCIGQHLAWAEMRLILVKLVLRFDFEAVKDKTFRWEELRTFLLVEKRPVFVRVKPRLV